jgi:hypothetical protein
MLIENHQLKNKIFYAAGNEQDASITKKVPLEV